MSWPGGGNPNNRFGASRKGHKKIEFDGYKFASQEEMQRYAFLKAISDIGDITDLKVHPRWPLKILDQNGQTVKITHAGYAADFSYHENGELIVEDVKPYVNKQDASWTVFQIKRRLMWALHGIRVRLISRGRIVEEKF